MIYVSFASSAKSGNDIQKSVTFYNKREAELGDRFFWEVIATLRRIEADPLHYQEKYLKKFRFALVHDFHSSLFLR